MPLTPFHLGPALLLGALAGRRLDPPALLVGSVIIDVRAALVLFGPLDPPVHGVLTTFAGAAVVGLLLGLVTVGAYRRALPAAPVSRYTQVLPDADVEWSRSPATVFAGSLVGVWSHVVLDALLYADVAPFAPVPGNPFLGLVSLPVVYLACALSFAGAAVVVAWRLLA